MAAPTQTSAPQAVIPKPDELNLDFYKATVAAGALCIQHCKECGTWTHPARYFCPNCTSPEYSFDKTSGRATVHSYTVSHFSVEPVWKAQVPYVTIVAELEEGPRIVAGSRLIGPDEVKIGLPLRIVTEKKSDEFAFFWADPDKGAS
jgi:uncharacterized OB-fold protein